MSGRKRAHYGFCRKGREEKNAKKAGNEIETHYENCKKTLSLPSEKIDFTAGIGASIQMSQCEILLAQYFRLKHTILAYVSQGVSALGFIVAPIIVGHYILSSNLLNVIMWYQAVILQGVVCGLTFKKPAYLKSKNTTRYNYISANPDDEEDILSKNSRELQIKRQDSTGTNVTIETHEIPNTIQQGVAGGSGSSTNQNTGKNWETFEDADPEKDTKYDVLKQDWELFEEDEDLPEHHRKAWEKFNEDDKKTRTAKSLQLELSFEETRNGSAPQMNTAETPMPLFSDLPVNNNTSYSYDILEQDSGPSTQPAVFMPTTTQKPYLFTSLELLQQPTFYKSFLTVMTTKFSIFVYYTLFPTYLYQELQGIKMRGVATLMGLLALSNLIFSGVSYWVNIDKKRRPICLWFLCWVGSFGYFMISDANTKQFLVFGAVQVTLSIATLQYVGTPLLGLTIRGETNREFNLISTMSGCAFIFFIFINSSFKNCFRLMALLHFFTGTVWFANYIYKKIMK